MVAPVLHTILPPIQFEAVNVAVAPSHNSVLVVVIVGVVGAGIFSIVTLFDEVLSPQILLHVALYSPDVLTWILAVVSPVLHFRVPVEQPFAVNVAT